MLYFNDITRWLVEHGGIGAEDIPVYSGETFFTNTNRWRMEEYSQGDAEQVYKTV